MTNDQFTAHPRIRPVRNNFAQPTLLHHGLGYLLLPENDLETAFLHTLLCALSCSMQRNHIRFTPVPLKARHDGWTPAKQLHFIEQLAATKSVRRACKAVGMSSVTAYALRNKPGAESFAAAWDSAVTFVPNLDRRRSPRAAQRLERFARKADKANEVNETHGPPNPSAPPVPASSASKALEALLLMLRRQEQELGSTLGG